MDKKIYSKLVWWYTQAHLRLLKVKFRRWVELQELREKIILASKDREEDFPDAIYSFLSSAFHIDKKYFDYLSWDKTLILFYQVSKKCNPSRSFPILKSKSKDTPKDGWDYEGRTWPFLSHTLASAYGWSLKYIANLPVEEAVSHIEEIFVQQQLDREFLWGMSPASVVYEEQTKTSHFNPLPRPEWMKLSEEKIEKVIKKVILPKSALPQGLVNYGAVSEEFQPKDIEFTGNTETFQGSGL